MLDKCNTDTHLPAPWGRCHIVTSYGFFVQHEFGWLLCAAVARIYRQSSRTRRREKRWQNRSRGKTLTAQAAWTSSTRSRGCIQKRGGALRKAKWWSSRDPRWKLGWGSDRKRCRETKVRAAWNEKKMASKSKPPPDSPCPLLIFFRLMGIIWLSKNEIQREKIEKMQIVKRAVKNLSGIKSCNWTGK